MNTKMYVGNLPFSSLEGDLRELFSEYGTVTDIFMPMDQVTGRPRGFAFITMDSPTAMNEAIRGLNGKELDGRALAISEARPKEERPRSNGGDRGFRNDRGPRSGSGYGQRY